MANKLTKKKIDLLIEQVLSEDFDYNEFNRKNDKTGSANDPGITKFLKKIGFKSLTDKQKKDAKGFYALGGRPESLSKQDIFVAILSGEFPEITRQIALYAYKKEDDDLIKLFNGFKPNSDTNLTSLEKGYHSDGIHVDPEFNYPEWIKNQEKRKKFVQQVAQSSAPANLFNNTDIITVLKDSSHKYHFWMADFVETVYTKAQQKAFDKDLNNLILDKFGEFRKLIDRIDPEDKALGKGKSIPNIPISGRYASRTGAETPATLKRIFENVGLGGAGPNTIQARFQKINDFVKKFENVETDENVFGRSVNTEKLFSNIIVLDYIRRIVQDYEASAGGFLFENFLAMIMSGTKEGGNIKIEDFTFEKSGKERLASAKLYRAGTKKFSGSSKLFFQAGLRTPLRSGNVITVFYVLAMKGQDLENIEISTKEVNIKAIGPVRNAETAKFKVFTDDDEEYIVDKDSSGGIEFSWPAAPVATVNFVSSKIESEKFDLTVEKALDLTKEKIGETFKSINNINALTTKFFSIVKSRSTKQDAQESNDLKLQTYDDVLDEIYNFREKALVTFTAAADKDTVRQDKAKQKIGTALAENKNKSLKELDKLIERVILNKMNKL